MVAQSDRACGSYAEGWVFEFHPRYSLVAQTCSDSSTAKRSAACVSVTVLGNYHYKGMSCVA